MEHTRRWLESTAVNRAGVSVPVCWWQSNYEPGKRHWLKIKKDYLADGSMSDSADLVVLGAYFGTGSKGNLPRRRQQRGYGFYLRLSVCFFRTMSQKPMQIGSPNLTWKCYMVSPGNPFILGSNGQRSRSEVTDILSESEFLCSCECAFFLLLRCVSHCMDNNLDVK